jgi:hypothetical protein
MANIETSRLVLDVYCLKSLDLFRLGFGLFFAVVFLRYEH